MAANCMMPARNNSLFLAGCPNLTKRSFNTANCAYSVFGMVKLSRSIFNFGTLGAFTTGTFTTGAFTSGAFGAATFFTATGFLLAVAPLVALTAAALGAAAFLAGEVVLGLAAALGVATGFGVFFDIFLILIKRYKQFILFIGVRK
jgi:hypothetical protein